MARKNKSESVESQFENTDAINETPVEQTESVESQFENTAAINETPVEQTETPAEEVEKTPEVIAKEQEIAALEEIIKAATDALKAQKKNLTLLKKELTALEKGEPVPSAGKTYIFISNGEPAGEIKTKAGKPLPYQGRLLVEMFIGDAPAGTELSYTKEQIMEKLEANYPCIGDKWDNFAWYKSQVLKPIGLVK